jgi:hypothetical protein
VGRCGLDGSGSDREEWWAFVNVAMNLQAP